MESSRLTFLTFSDHSRQLQVYRNDNTVQTETCGLCAAAHGRIRIFIDLTANVPLSNEVT